jgi:hypothetical protein
VKKLNSLRVHRVYGESCSLKFNVVESVNGLFGDGNLVILLAEYYPLVANLTKRELEMGEKYREANKKYSHSESNCTHLGGYATRQQSK